VAYLTRALRLQAGVVISASHNPFADNGIKFFSSDGAKLPDDVELEIEAGLSHSMHCNESATLGRARRVEDAAGRYIEFCKSTFPSNLDLRGMKIVVDCANGAAYQVAPHVLHELGADVEAIGVSPDGFNINDHVGATKPKALQQAVRRHGAELGIALDGDGDRLMMVDGEGTLYDGDQLLYIIAMTAHAAERLPGSPAPS
jgi:phosphoglucosamine mutase